MNRMIKNSLAALIVSLISAIVIISCGRQEQHYIEKIIGTMEKGGTPQEIEKVKLYTIDSLHFALLDSLGLTKNILMPG